MTKKGKLLVITGAPFLEAGNQSIQRTLRGLAARGFQIEVWLLDKHKPSLYLQNVTIRTFTTPPLLKKLGKWLLSLRDQDKPRKDDLSNRNIYEIIDYRNDEVNQWFSGLPATLYFAMRLLIVTLAAYPTLRKSVDAVWGYERGGILPAKIISSLLRVPCITSFQGTVLNFYIHRYGMWGTFLRLPLDLLSTWLKANLVIMTDDGTKGLDTLIRLGHASDKVLFVPNGVDIEDLTAVQPFLKSDLGIKETEFLFVIASRLVIHKRVDRALVLVKALLEHGFENFKLIITGDGPDKNYFVPLAKEMRIDQHVIFYGAHPYRETLRIIACADMIWSFQEGSNLTNTVQDALALGKQVLVLEDGSLEGFLKRSPAIKAEQVWVVPLEQFPNRAVDIIKTWSQKCSPSAESKLQSKYGIWSWDNRLDEIERCILQLTQTRSNDEGLI